MKTETAPMQLVVVAEGKLIKNNFPEFKDHLEGLIASINTDLNTDEEFGQAKADSDRLNDLEKSLDIAMDELLKNFEEINQIQEGVKDLKAASREKRLALDKLVRARTDEIKKEIVDDGIGRLTLKNDNHRLLVANAIQRKRSISTMRDAVDEVVAALNETTAKCQAIIDEAIEKHGEAVVYGESQLLGMSPQSLQVELERRVERIAAELEKERLRQAAAKAQAEADAAKKTEPEPLPAPKKVDGIPVGQAAVEATQKEAPALAQEGATAAEESEHFKNVLILALAPVKSARGKLVHPINIEAAENLAREFGEAFAKFNVATS